MTDVFIAHDVGFNRIIVDEETTLNLDPGGVCSSGVSMDCLDDSRLWRVDYRIRGQLAEHGEYRGRPSPPHSTP